MRAFSSTKLGLPSEVRERFVGVCHAVHVVLLLDRGTFVLCGHEDLGSETLCHWLTLLGARGIDEPTVCERNTALLGYLARNLVVSTTDATRADLHKRRYVANCGLEGLEWIHVLGLDDIEGSVDELAGSILLAVPHNGVDEARNRLRTVHEVRAARILVLYWVSHD